MTFARILADLRLCLVNIDRSRRELPLPQIEHCLMSVVASPGIGVVAVRVGNENGIVNDRRSPDG